MHAETVVYKPSTTPMTDCKGQETTGSLGIRPSTLTDVDLAMDKAVWRKLDFRLLPTLAMFHLLSFLVRKLAIVCVLCCAVHLHFYLGSNQPRQCSSGWIAEAVGDDQSAV